MANWLCKTCGTQYPPAEAPPERCPICDDERQYLPPGGQQWITLDELQADRANAFREIEPGITAIATAPSFGIGEQAYLLETADGLFLWDLIALIDDATVAEIRRRGRLTGIAISHPHYYTTMVEWSRAFGGIPVYLHEDDREWAQYPDDALTFWSGDTLSPAPGLTLIRTGGHFNGGTMLHRAGDASASGERADGVLLSGDIISVVADRRWVTFLYSYPNAIPLDETSVRRIAEMVAPYPFARVRDAFDRHVMADGSVAVQRSAERYIRRIRGDAGPTIG